MCRNERDGHLTQNWYGRHFRYRLSTTMDKYGTPVMPWQSQAKQRKTEHYDLQPIALEKAFGLQLQEVVDKTK